MALIRGLLFLVVLIVLIVMGATIKLGDRTFFQHVSRIWQSDETQDMVEGVKDKSGPVVDRVKRGVKAGVKEATRDDAGSAR
jgi:hypothetical protein